MSSASPAGVIARPPYQLRTLPLRYRWEVTRRHPYYQEFWHDAPVDPAVFSEDDPLREIARLGLGAAVNRLGMIGVTLPITDPSCEFDELDGTTQLEDGWLNGAMHPMTVRSIAGMMVADLDEEARRAIGIALLQSVGTLNVGDADLQLAALDTLRSCESEDMNRFFREPLVAVNPQATNQQVREAIAELLPHWRTQLDLPETRVQGQTILDHLRVWDLREAYREGRYHVGEERTLGDLATELGIPVRTVTNRYHAAFQLITGQPYSPELWSHLILNYKLPFVDLSDQTARVLLRRPTADRSQSVTLVTETTLDANVDAITERSRDDRDRIADRQDLVLELRSLQDAGLSSSEMLHRLVNDTSILSDPEQTAELEQTLEEFIRQIDPPA